MGVRCGSNGSSLVGLPCLSVCFNMLLHTPPPPSLLPPRCRPPPPPLPSPAAGFWFFVLPIYMWVKNLVWPRTGPLADKF